MLTNYELLQLYEDCGFSEKARAAIKRIRSSDPSRRVRSARGNVSGSYPSHKMGFTIQFESHKNELPYVYQSEHNDKVLEYYDQPPPIKLSYLSQGKKGEKHVAFNYTPDFFIIRNDPVKNSSVGWIECKTEEELQRLGKEQPERYVQGKDSQWYCPPGEEFAKPLGFFFQVISSASISEIFARNIVYLRDYLCDENICADEEAKRQLLQIVQEEPGITLDELRHCADKASSDDINILIAKELLYFNLYTFPLAEPKRARLFRDQDTANAYATMFELPFSPPSNNTGTVDVSVGTTVLWDNKPWLIVNVGETRVTLLAEDERQAVVELPSDRFYGLISHGRLVGLKNEVQDTLDVGKIRELVAGASREDLKLANHRYEVVKAVLHKEKSLEDYKEADRTIFYWMSAFRKAERLYGNGYIGLLPATSKRGNRGTRLSKETLDLIDDFIKNDYQNLKQENKFVVFSKFVLKCEEKYVSPVCYKVFTREVEKRSGYEQTKKRMGHKAAYKQKPWIWELEWMTPRHGDRPWEIGHIDHTQLDIELIHPDTKKNLGRPWLTVLSDAYSRRILAIYITFDKPSYRSSMMVLRECVRRHNRLPQIMIYDGGSDFKSTYFETLLARYDCTRKVRPGSEPRFGSVCERIFGTVNTQFVHNLIGNTQIMKNVRQVTRDVNPKELAVWTLEKFYYYLCQWCYEVYDCKEHPALGQTPREAFGMGLLQHGHRANRRIPYDDDFIKFTLPTTIKGTAKVQLGSGVKINYISYWTNAFQNPEVEKTQVPVRYDPYDVGKVYAYVKGKWEPCISEYHHYFKGRSEREIQLASEELRKRNNRHGQQFNVTAKKLAIFLMSVEAEEALEMQRLHDSEAKHVLLTVDSGQVGEKEDSSHTLAPPSNIELELEEQVMDISTSKKKRNLVIYGDY